MNKNVIFAFVIGAMTGGAIAWKVSADRSQNFFEKEIADYKTSYKKDFELSLKKKLNDKYGKVEEETSSTEKYVKVEVPDNHIVIDFDTPDGNGMERLYTTYGAYSKLEDKATNTEFEIDKPYVIPPEEYSEFDDYQEISLKYFSDGVITDEKNEPIDEFGIDVAKHFGEFEDDSVYVRDDSRKCDYEILDMGVPYHKEVI